jgi:hypothetical protein
MKEDGVRELKAMNDTYKDKCSILEVEIQRAFD